LGVFGDTIPVYSLLFVAMTKQLHVSRWSFGLNSDGVSWISSWQCRIAGFKPQFLFNAERIFLSKRLRIIFDC